MSSLPRAIYQDSRRIPQLLAVMPLVGHDSPVQSNPYHEPDSNLLGPHGYEKPQVFASAERNGLFEPEHTEVTTRANTSTDECASDEDSLQSIDFLPSHHSALLNTRRSWRSDSLLIFVSN